MTEEQQQEKSTQEVKYSFSSFPLYEHKTPDFREKKGFEYVRYGDENNYPDYLIYLFNRSAIHNSIVSGKARFILGQGWSTKGSEQMPDFLRKVNAVDTLDELTYKIILDRLIFGGYALRINWMGGKISSIYHQPFQTIRTNTELSEFIVSQEWTRDQSTKATFKSNAKVPTDATFYTPFNPNKREGTQILYVTDYRPQIKIYPLPEYIACNAYIETDIEISNFHLNNIKTGFAAGTMVTFFNGKPAPEEKKELERDLKSKVSGTDNAGEILLNFAEVNEVKPEILQLRSNELDKQYEQLGKDTTQNIFIGHGVTSPMLFGVKTEGQLGGRSEIDLAWQLFSINYVEPRRKQFESEFNYLIQFTPATQPIVLKPLQGLGIEITEALITANLDKNEIRELIGDRLGIKLEQQVTPQPTTTLSKEKINEFESILINKFSQLGISSEGLEFATELNEDDKVLIDYLKGKKELDINKAKKDLKINVEEVLKRLIENNVIQGEYLPNGNVKIQDIQPPTKEGESKGYRVKTYWRYTGPIDSKNRDFCKKMLTDPNLKGKLYTREEIDQLNIEMKAFNDEKNYINEDVDIWKYRGGWYTVPDTNGLLHRPSCRHYWQTVLVKEKI